MTTGPGPTGLAGVARGISSSAVSAGRPASSDGVVAAGGLASPGLGASTAVSSTRPSRGVGATVCGLTGTGRPGRVTGCTSPTGGLTAVVATLGATRTFPGAGVFTSGRPTVPIARTRGTSAGTGRVVGVTVTSPVGRPADAAGRVTGSSGVTSPTCRGRPPSRHGSATASGTGLASTGSVSAGLAGRGGRARRPGRKTTTTASRPTACRGHGTVGLGATLSRRLTIAIGRRSFSGNVNCI